MKERKLAGKMALGLFTASSNIIYSTKAIPKSNDFAKQRHMKTQKAPRKSVGQAKKSASLKAHRA